MHLDRRSIHVTAALGGELCRRRLCPNSARAAVVGYAVHRHIVDHSLVVNIVYVRDVHVIDRAIVVEVATTPFAAMIAGAWVSKAVVDAAVKADSWSPASWVPVVQSYGEAPVARRPQHAYLRRKHPRARNPVIVVGVWTPCPISGYPDVARRRTRWLNVYG